MEVQMKMERANEKYSLVHNILCLLALLVVITPLLMLGNYNYPTADDWSFGKEIYHVRMNGGGFLEILKAIFSTVQYNYTNWEGRFSATFLACLQPGVWGEGFYRITTWLMIGSVIVGEVLLVRFLMDGKKKDNRLLYLPVALPMLCMQMLYVPYPEETFYWYTGSVNYTFVFAMSLILAVIFLKLAKGGMRPLWKKIVLSVAGVVLAVLVGGNNFATSLSTFLTLLCLSVVFLLWNHGALKRTWYITLTMAVAFLMSVLAPANMVRINANFGGETRSALGAILDSLSRSFMNIVSWTDIKVLILIVLMLPYMVGEVSFSRFRFELPGVFTLVSFGIYASQCTATMYVDGTTGGGRMGDILFYSYYVWLFLNVWYWCGWFAHKFKKGIEQTAKEMLWDPGEATVKAEVEAGKITTRREAQEKYDALGMRKITIWRRYLHVVFGGIALVLCVLVLMDKTELTIYKAYRNLRQGFAQQYAVEWDARLELLKDASVDKVEVAPLSVLPEMLLYTDLQYKDGFYWVNEACAEYYGKESVDLIPKK